MTAPTAAPARRPRVPEDARPAPRADAEIFSEPAAPAPEAAPVREVATTLQAAAPELRRPFAQRLVELKPSATTKDRSRALCVAYVDARAYQARLDAAVGAWGWSVEYRPVAGGMVCRLTVLGVVREDVGELDTADANAVTSACMQAFKRACAAFGLGRYLYALPMVWADYDDAKKQIAGDRGAIVAQMYAALPAE